MYACLRQTTNSCRIGKKKKKRSIEELKRRTDPFQSILLFFDNFNNPSIVVYLQTREYITISPTNPTDLSSVIIFFLCFPFVHLIISSYKKKGIMFVVFSLYLPSLLFYQEKERKDLDIISSSWVKPLLVRIREGSVPNVADGFIGPNFSKRVPIT